MSKLRRLPKPVWPREARRAYLERRVRVATEPCERAWAARELGKLWAEEALEEIKAALT